MLRSIIYLDAKLPTHRKTESIGSESSGSVYSESPTVTNKSWERGASSTSLDNISDTGASRSSSPKKTKLRKFPSTRSFTVG